MPVAELLDDSDEDEDENEGRQGQGDRERQPRLPTFETKWWKLINNPRVADKTSFFGRQFRRWWCCSFATVPTTGLVSSSHGGVVMRHRRRPWVVHGPWVEISLFMPRRSSKHAEREILEVLGTSRKSRMARWLDLEWRPPVESLEEGYKERGSRALDGTSRTVARLQTTGSFASRRAKTSVDLFGPQRLRPGELDDATSR
jgi:hypothetical protein